MPQCRACLTQFESEINTRSQREEDLCEDCRAISYEAALDGFVEEENLFDEIGDPVGIFELEELVESRFSRD